MAKFKPGLIVRGGERRREEERGGSEVRGSREVTHYLSGSYHVTLNKTLANISDTL